MEYFVAVASTDGRLIDQHFGKAGAFSHTESGG